MIKRTNSFQASDRQTSTYFKPKVEPVFVVARNSRLRSMTQPNDLVVPQNVGRKFSPSPQNKQDMPFEIVEEQSQNTVEPKNIIDARTKFFNAK